MDRQLILDSWPVHATILSASGRKYVPGRPRETQAGQGRREHR